jgi:hypothetical protein
MELGIAIDRLLSEKLFQNDKINILFCRAEVNKVMNYWYEKHGTLNDYVNNEYKGEHAVLRHLLITKGWGLSDITKLIFLVNALSKRFLYNIIDPRNHILVDHYRSVKEIYCILYINIMYTLLEHNLNKDQVINYVMLNYILGSVHEVNRHKKDFYYFKRYGYDTIAATMVMNYCRINSNRMRDGLYYISIDDVSQFVSYSYKHVLGSRFNIDNSVSLNYIIFRNNIFDMFRMPHIKNCVNIRFLVESLRRFTYRRRNQCIYHTILYYVDKIINNIITQNNEYFYSENIHEDIKTAVEALCGFNNTNIETVKENLDKCLDNKYCKRKNNKIVEKYYSILGEIIPSIPMDFTDC